MRFVVRPLYTLVVYSLSLYVFTFEYSYASEFSETQSISISDADSFELQPDAFQTPDKDANIFRSPLLTMGSKNEKFLYGSLYLCMTIAASIALYLMVPKVKKVQQIEETIVIEGFSELENELLEWFTTDPLLKDKGSRASFQSDFDSFKNKEYSIIFSEHQDTVLPPQDDLLVRKFKLDFWKDYEKMLRPYFYFNQFQIGKFILLALENVLFGTVDYQGKSFFNFEKRITGRLNFDHIRSKKVFEEYKPTMDKARIEGIEKAMDMISKYEFYYNRVMDYKEKYCSDIEERRHLALKPNHEIAAVLKKQNNTAP